MEETMNILICTLVAVQSKIICSPTRCPLQCPLVDLPYTNITYNSAVRGCASVLQQVVTYQRPPFIPITSYPF